MSKRSTHVSVSSQWVLALIAAVVGFGVIISSAESRVVAEEKQPVDQNERTPAEHKKAMQNLKIILLGMHNYHDMHASFPPAVVMGPDG